MEISSWKTTRVQGWQEKPGARKCVSFWIWTYRTGGTKMFITWRGPRGSHQVKEYKISPEQSLLTGCRTCMYVTSELSTSFSISSTRTSSRQIGFLYAAAQLCKIQKIFSHVDRRWSLSVSQTSGLAYQIISDQRAKVFNLLSTWIRALLSVTNCTNGSFYQHTLLSPPSTSPPKILETRTSGVRKDRSFQYRAWNHIFIDSINKA